MRLAVVTAHPQSARMTELQERIGTFPGAVSVVAINAAPRVIQSAFVHRNDAKKRALVQLGFYPSTNRDEQREAATRSMGLVLAYLGPEWSGRVRV